jgi:hypothetical protein
MDQRELIQKPGGASRSAAAATAGSLDFSWILETGYLLTRSRSSRQQLASPSIPGDAKM